MNCSKKIFVIIVLLFTMLFSSLPSFSVELPKEFSHFYSIACKLRKNEAISEKESTVFLHVHEKFSEWLFYETIKSLDIPDTNWKSLRKIHTTLCLAIDPLFSDTALHQPLSKSSKDCFYAQRNKYDFFRMICEIKQMSNMATKSNPAKYDRKKVEVEDRYDSWYFQYLEEMVDHSRRTPILGNKLALYFKKLMWYIFPDTVIAWWYVRQNNLVDSCDRDTIRVISPGYYEWRKSEGGLDFVSATPNDIEQLLSRFN